jgi:uncharacterized protein (TIGR03067 family)
MRIKGLCVVLVGLLVASEVGAVADRPPRKKKQENPVHLEIARLAGTWELSGWKYNGRTSPPAVLARLRDLKLTFTKDNVTAAQGGHSYTIRLTINLTKAPKEIDLPLNRFRAWNGKAPALYALEGDTLTICQDLGARARPKDMSADVGSRNFLMIWKRVKP